MCMCMCVCMCVARREKYLQYQVIKFLCFLCVTEPRPSKLFGFVSMYWALVLYLTGKCF